MVALRTVWNYFRQLRRACQTAGWGSRRRNPAFTGAIRGSVQKTLEKINSFGNKESPEANG